MLYCQRHLNASILLRIKTNLVFPCLFLNVLQHLNSEVSGTQHYIRGVKHKAKGECGTAE